ncbi:hypothetical protein INT47_010890 [Mucor saturninus]|uniref:Uncharacterized protein n=1 Tax=Mucor saturninus TaxID=64648 RepID=A0A8H7V2N1_9FUNG|nr:hypothetical protein INT47_010890 [Mucor saturninus]
MKLYQFCKDAILHPNVSIVYSRVTRHEGRIVDEVNLGAFLNIKDILKVGWKVRTEDIDYEASAVSSEYVIKGDNTPRVIYRVYKLDRPEQERDDEESVTNFRNIIDTLHTSEKERIYQKNLKKFTRKTFVFFACLDNFDKDWPQDFLVTEKTINFDDLYWSVRGWNCVSENKLRVDKSSLYFKLQLPMTPKQAMICAYMHCIKILMCAGCCHAWSHQDLLNLLRYRQAYIQAARTTLLDDEAYRMQKKFKYCKLWIQFLNNENAFARRTPGFRRTIKHMLFSS